MQTKAIIFDVDGTLTEEHSWTALTRDLGASVDEHLKIYEDMKAGLIDLPTAEAQLCNIWRRTGRAHKATIMEFFTSWPVRNDAREVITQLQAKGYKICIITGFADIYAEYIAQQLDIKDYYANTTMSFDDNDQLISFSYKPNQAETKHQQLKDYCSKQNISLEDCITVGNGENDVAIFKATGRGVLIDAFSTSEEVQKAAWKTIERLTDILELL